MDPDNWGVRRLITRRSRWHRNESRLLSLMSARRVNSGTDGKHRDSSVALVRVRSPLEDAERVSVTSQGETMERAASKRLAGGLKLHCPGGSQTEPISDFVVSTPSHGCATVPARVYPNSVTVSLSSPSHSCSISDGSNAPHLRRWARVRQ